MQPARNALFVFQGFFRDLTLVSTRATQLTLVFYFIFLLDYSILMVIFL